MIDNILLMILMKITKIMILNWKMKKIEMIKIFFKQMEVFFYMKRLEKERQNLYLKFMKKLRENKIDLIKNIIK